jgi:hypothetical protein
VDLIDKRRGSRHVQWGASRFSTLTTWTGSLSLEPHGHEMGGPRAGNTLEYRGASEARLRPRRGHRYTVVTTYTGEKRHRHAETQSVSPHPKYALPPKDKVRNLAQHRFARSPR